jgi:hypothetical protein
MKCEPPVAIALDSNPRRRNVVNKTTADVELGRIKGGTMYTLDPLP